MTRAWGTTRTRCSREDVFSTARRWKRGLHALRSGTLRVLSTVRCRTRRLGSRPRGAPSAGPRQQRSTSAPRPRPSGAARRRRRPLLAGPGGRRPCGREPGRHGAAPHRRQGARGRARAGERAVPLPPAGHAEDVFPAAPGAGRPPGPGRHPCRDRHRLVRPAMERGPGAGGSVDLEPEAVPPPAAAAQGGEVDEDRRRQRGAAAPGPGAASGSPPTSSAACTPRNGPRPWSAPARSWSRRSGRDRRGRRRCCWGCSSWWSWSEVGS